MATSPGVKPPRIGVWDLPTRLFHWALVLLVCVSVATGLAGGDDAMAVHQYSGMLILALVVFRVLWGVAGGRHARFANFLRGPADVLRYTADLLGGRPAKYLGHNPLGGWSVLALLLALAAQAVSGLFANDDATFEGPLAARVSKDTSDFLTHIHHLTIDILYVLVGLHVAAVLLYLLLRRDNLILPMISGRKAAPKENAGKTDEGWRGSGLLALVLLLASAAAVWVLTRRG
jgi:cytochrome b